ncbi:MAG: anhydro-N-acetylmuramic acid kinase [Bacteroidia bacterium]|jgi:anhydro-N-acetylmuramic acid kinase
MSGTSIDGIDAALIDCSTNPPQLLCTHEHPINQDTREAVAAISQPGDNEIERMGVLDRQLGTCFADAARALLSKAEVATTAVRAIGSHGQTIRHRPPSAGTHRANSFTLQIGDPTTIAELTGITTVADFRRRDIAAGGEGAPLAPAFHQAYFAADGINRAIVNIGGIANISVLQGKRLLMGFDSGPGNTLMDHWIKQNLGAPFDRDGEWAAGGTPCEESLQVLLSEPYFNKSGPRSTGKELFNSQWLASKLPAVESLKPQNLQATLLELTARSIALGIKNCSIEMQEVYLCGGGAHNQTLLKRLAAELAPASVGSTLALGLHPDWVEAVTFAWLAQQTLAGLPGNAPAVTGASGERVLGAIYPAGN